MFNFSFWTNNDFIYGSCVNLQKIGEKWIKLIFRWPKANDFTSQPLNNKITMGCFDYLLNYNKTCDSAAKNNISRFVKATMMVVHNKNQMSKDHAMDHHAITTWSRYERLSFLHLTLLWPFSLLFLCSYPMKIRTLWGR